MLFLAVARPVSNWYRTLWAAGFSSRGSKIVMLLWNPAYPPLRETSFRIFPVDGVCFDVSFFSMTAELSFGPTASTLV